MPKRVYIIHGWGGNPGEGWLVWLKNNLEGSGFKVFTPNMPDTDNPRISTWTSHLDKIVGTADKNTYFIGHSIGCQTIMRYLEQLPSDQKAGGAIFVAGWVNLTNHTLYEN